MQHELALYEYELEKRDYINQVFEGIKNSKVKIVSMLPQYVNILNKLIPPEIEIASTVDYPLGLNSIKLRNSNVMTVAKYGLNYIDLCINSHLLVNKEWDNMEKDLVSNYKICNDNGCKLRIVYDYRRFSKGLIDIAPILEQCGIEYFIPSTGFYIDNSYDNILAANAFRSINQSTKIILSGNIWTDKHYQSCKKFKPHGIRFYYLSNLKMIGV